MAENWQANDLAECIDVSDIEFPGWTSIGGRELTLGMVYIVQDVGFPDDQRVERCLYLGWHLAWKSERRFRKVPPIDECEPDELIAPVERELVDG